MRLNKNSKNKDKDIVETAKKMVESLIKQKKEWLYEKYNFTSWFKELIIEEDLFYKPFNDIGTRRIFLFSALGIKWKIEW